MNTSKKMLALGVMLLLAGFSTGCGDASKAADPSDPSQAAQRVVDRLQDHGVVDSSRFGQATVDELMKRCEELEAAALKQEEDKEAQAQCLHHRYSVVEHSVTSVTEDGRIGLAAVPRRSHLVNPQGEWFEIPESDREWAMAVKNGTVVELPATVLSWVKVEQSAVLIHGSFMIDALSGEYRSFAGPGVRGHDEGIYFFVEK